MIKIEEATPEVLRKIFPDFYSHCQRRLRTETILKLQEGKVSFVLIATVKKVPIGFTAIYNNKEGERTGVTIVKSEYRGMGIGTSLLRERTKVWPEIVTEVWEGNIPSRRMCEKAGLTAIGTKTHWAEISKEYRTILVFKKEE